MDWETHARRMAADVVRPESRWYEPLGNTPRHLFVPRWWARGAEAWELRDGPSDPEAWMRAVYANKTLVTRVGPRTPTAPSPAPRSRTDTRRHRPPCRAWS